MSGPLSLGGGAVYKRGIATVSASLDGHGPEGKGEEVT